jgi:hypothetical protein
LRVSTPISGENSDVQKGDVCKLTEISLWSILEQSAPQALRPRGFENKWGVEKHNPTACAKKLCGRFLFFSGNMNLWFFIKGTICNGIFGVNCRAL